MNTFKHENPEIYITNTSSGGFGTNIGDKLYSSMTVDYSDGSQRIFLKEMPAADETNTISTVGMIIGGSQYTNSEPKWVFYQQSKGPYNMNQVRKQDQERMKQDQERMKQDQERMKQERERMKQEQERMKLEQERMKLEQVRMKLEQERMRLDQERMKLEQKQNVQDKQSIQFTEENIGIEIQSNLKNLYEKYVSIKKPLTEHKNPRGPQRYEESKKELSMFDGLNISCSGVVGCTYNVPMSGSECFSKISGEPEIEITFLNPDNEQYKAKILRNHAGVVTYVNFVYFKLLDQRKSHQDFCNSLLLQLQKKWESKRKSMPEKDINITFLYSDVKWN
jgi:hypothetical protein